MMIRGKGYEIAAKNLAAHEWCGLKAKVVESTDPKRKGTEGVVVDETQNTLVLEAKGKEIVVPKKECVFEFDLGKDEKGNAEKTALKGKDFLKRPEDRAKETK